MNYMTILFMIFSKPCFCKMEKRKTKRLFPSRAWFKKEKKWRDNFPSRPTKSSLKIVRGTQSPKRVIQAPIIYVAPFP